MIQDFRYWLGPQRVRALIAALIFTGIASILVGVFASGDWVTTAQSLLAIAFIGLATVIIGSRMGPFGRRRLFFTIGPALGLGVLAFLGPQSLFPLLLGAAFGWILAAQFFVREPTLTEYREAIRYMRKQEYKAAIKLLNKLVRDAPRNLDHLDFRARLYQLAGNNNAALKDYETMQKIEPQDPRAYGGISGIYVQKGDYEVARPYSLQAFERDAHNPAAPHDLALIEDRLQNSQAVIDYLERALTLRLNESRLLLLAYLWMARAYFRLNQPDAADEALQKLKHQRRGLQEWRRILEDEQSATVRTVYESDIGLAGRAIDFDLKTAAKLFEDRS